MVRRHEAAVLAVLAAFLLVWVPHGAFAAGPQILLSPTSGLKGTPVTVTGTGFGASLSVTVTYGGSTITTSTTSAGGSFTASFNVPSSSSTGNVLVTATDSSSNSASADFTVTSPTLSVNPSQGLRGAVVTITGTGFSDLSGITVTYNVASITTTPSSVTTSNVGGFSATITIPGSSIPGGNLVTATDASGNSASVTFTVASPAITPTPSSGPRGQVVSVSGTSFRPSLIVHVTYDGSTVASINDSVSGTFVVVFTVPATSPLGSNTIVATDTAGNTASATYTVTSPTVKVAPTSGTVGSSVTVSGTGFTPSATVSLTYDGSLLQTSPGSVSTTSGGSFTATFTVPPSTSGPHTIAAADADSNRNTTSLRVLPSLVLTSPVAVVGGSVQVSGNGFAPSSAVTLTYDGLPITNSVPPSVATGATGSFTATFQVSPATTLGLNTVKAADVAGDSGSAKVNVTAGFVFLTFTPATGSTPLSPSNSFAVTYKTNGVLHTSNANGTTLRVLADASSALSVAPESSASNSTEMWCLAVSGNGCQPLSFSSGSAGQQTYSYTYYDIVLQKIAYSVAGGGNPAVDFNYTTAPSTPRPGYVLAYASAPAATGTEGLWVVKGGSVSSPAVIAGGTGERWEVGGDVSSTLVSANGALNIVYYHQFVQTASFSAEGGGRPPFPALMYSFLGAAKTIPLTNSSATAWMDAGSTASLTSPLVAPGGVERWSAIQNSWTVSGTGAAAPVTYAHQFFVLVGANSLAGAVTSPPSGWFDENTSVTINAAANQGWKFEGWVSPANPLPDQQSSLQVTVSGPVNETAVVYAGLTISADSFGSVSYQSSGAQGTVGPGSTDTVYLPPGSLVQFRESPLSPFNVFNSWSGTGALNGTAPITSVSAPLTVSASFGLNYLYVGVAAAVAVAVVAGALLVRRRRAGSDEGEDEEGADETEAPESS